MATTSSSGLVHSNSASGQLGGGSALASAQKLTMPAASVIPQGVGAPPPPGLDPKKGKLMCIKVRMLDDTVGVFHLGHKAIGHALFEEVCRHLNLLECDYFGLEFLDCYGNSCWLDKDKSILKQITVARSDARFYFVVKFYTPNPADLEEEYTRYLFALQIKRDLSCGHFLCNENTAALMASYIVQSECGDFSSDDYYDHSYLSPVRFIPNQSAEFEKKVMDNHKKLIGMSPAESDLALLETARRSEFYGVKFHPCRDAEGTPVHLTVLHSGIKVYHQLSCANTFSWAKVRKLSFKRKKLFVKMHPESYAYYKDTVDFTFETRNECKMFWKKCIEHHAFFRCNEIAPIPRHQSSFFTKGSSFRYSGRTQKQLIDYVREHQKRREPFTRPIHSSMTRKVLSDERLLPTPDSSQPGTLVRPPHHQNGTLSSAEGEEMRNENEDESMDRINLPPPGYAAIISTPMDEKKDQPQQMLPSILTTSTTDSPRKTKDESRHPTVRITNGSPGREMDLPLSPRSPPPQNETLVKENNANNPYSISSPYRKGARLQSIESSSSGQLTLAGSLQQIPPTTPIGNPPKSIMITSAEHRTPPSSLKKRPHEPPTLSTPTIVKTSFDNGTPSPLTNGRHNYENVEQLSSFGMYDISHQQRTGTLGSSNSGGSIERTIPVRVLFQNDHQQTTDRSISSSLNPPSTSERAGTMGRRHAFSSKAFCITKELLMTERTYVRDLAIVAKHFKSLMTPFCENPSNQPQAATTPTTKQKSLGIMKSDKHHHDHRQEAAVINEILAVFEPLHDFHDSLLQEIERRHNAWEHKLTNQQQANTPSPSDAGVQKIGDILLCGIHNSLQTYQHYIAQATTYLTCLNELYRSNRKFANLYKEFESQKICYVPINLLLLKPLRRLFTYEAILTRLTAHYIEEGGINPDLSDCKVAQEKLSNLTAGGCQGRTLVKPLENFTKLVQIERDLNDVQNLVLTTRVFIREGSLQRFTRKEPVQRLFLLFNDCLLYAGRSGGPNSSQQMTFRLHGQIPLRGLMLENGDALRMSSSQNQEKHSFTIYGGNRSFVVAAGSAEEKQMWLEDINRAVMEAKESITNFPHFPSLKSASSTDDVSSAASPTSSMMMAGGGTSTFKSPSSTTAALASPTADLDSSDPSSKSGGTLLTAQSPTLSGERHWYYRANDTLHVCWHRSTTLGADQWHSSAAKGQMSGYLLRKFRTSSGWQKLWVVFCDFCLFFHKNHQDGLPLASLPLLGYVLTLPDAKDEIHKDYVFKLQYKMQYYFFRADSDYAYNRWLEVLRIACHDQLNRP